MTNAFFNATGQPATGAFAASAPMRSEFQDIQAGFDKLPALVAGTAIVVNSAGTALSNTVGRLALAGDFATTGGAGTTLVQQATVTLTLPAVSGTLATLAGTETLSNKTLVAPALGTPASGIATNLTGTASGLTAGNVTLSNLSGTASGLTAGNVTTNANLTGPITSSGNTTAVASQTGSGSKFVMDTSPSLITPNIGDATASSINGNTIDAGSDVVVLLTASQTLTNKTLTAASLGSSTATTQAANNNSTRVATTAYLDTKLGVANGIATLDGSGTLTAAQIPASLLGATVYKGVWNATTNSPVLASGVGVAGNYYIVNVAGTTTLDGISSWNVGDTAIFSGSVWNKITSTAGVTSVAGKTGAVTLAASDLTNGTTGSGAVVLANTPTLIAPVLGIAAATSLALGGASLGSDALAVTGTATISGGINIGVGTTYAIGADTFLGRRSAAIWLVGGPNSASPVPQGIATQAVLNGTSNTAGADWTFTASRSTGTGAGGAIIFQTSPAGVSGTTQNASMNALVLDSTQGATVTGNITSTAGRVILGTNAQINGATLNTVKLRNAADSADAALFAGATTLSGALTYGGVALTNGVTGTGRMVLSADPTFTGTVTVDTLTGALASTTTATTQSIGNNSTKIATTAYVDVTRVSGARLTNSIAADVTLTNVGTYYDGPSVAQGATGTWFASGTVSLAGNNPDTFYVKLWDGTTVIASGLCGFNGTGPYVNTISLSGYITSPSGNIRMTAQNTTSGGTIMIANATGNSKDSTVSAIRIA